MKKIKDLFPVFVKHTLSFEGGYADDPFDSGGKTIFGVSKNNWPDAFNEIYALAIGGRRDDAIVRAKEFYRANFFNELYNYIDDSSLAFKIFDFGINAGKKKAVKLLQRSINDYTKKLKLGKLLVVDGSFGNKTLTEVNYYSKNAIYELYIKRLEKFYRSLRTFWRFGKGWMKRLNERKQFQKRIRTHFEVRIKQAIK